MPACGSGLFGQGLQPHHRKGANALILAISKLVPLWVLRWSTDRVLATVFFDQTQYLNRLADFVKYPFICSIILVCIWFRFVAFFYMRHPVSPDGVHP